MPSPCPLLAPLRRALFGALFASALASVPYFAEAGLANRNVIPFGDTETRTANAGVAGGPSAGSVFYNPAALTRITDPSVSVSGSTYVYSKTRADLFARVDDTDLAYEASGFDSIPATVIGTRKAGAKDGPWTLSYFVLVPESSRIENQRGFSTPNAEITVIQVLSSSDLWLGGAAGVALGREWSIGLALYGIQHAESTMLSVTTAIPADPTLGAIQASHLNFSSFGFSAAVGLLYDPAPWVSLGLRAQSPLIQITGSGQGYTGALASGGTSPGLAEVSEEKIAPDYKLPLDFSLGARFRPWKPLSVLTDVSFQLGSSFQIFPGSAFNSRIDTDATFRFNLGLDLELSSAWTIGTGFLLNPSAIHDLDGRGEGATRETFHGVTAGVSRTIERMRVGLAAFYLWSSGEIAPIGLGADARSAYGRTGVGGTFCVSYLL